MIKDSGKKTNATTQEDRVLEQCIVRFSYSNWNCFWLGLKWKN